MINGESIWVLSYNSWGIDTLGTYGVLSVTNNKPEVDELSEKVYSKELDELTEDEYGQVRMLDALGDATIKNTWGVRLEEIPIGKKLVKLLDYQEYENLY